MYAVVLIKSTLGSFMGPAENALLPRLVDEEHLATANALNTLNNNLARLVGPALGGAVLAYLGFTYAVLLDAASFVIAGLLIALIRAPRSVTRVVSEAPAADTPRPNVWRELLEGLVLVRGSRLITALFLFMGVAMISEGFFEVLVIPYVADVLRGGAQELGWMMTAQAVGGLVGGVLVGRLSQRVAPAAFIGPGLLILGLLDIAIFNMPVLALNLLFFVLAGPAVIGLQTGIQTLLQTNVEDRYMGRVFGAFGTVISLAILTGQLVASLVGGTTGAAPLMTLAGGLMAAMGLGAIVMLPRLTPKVATPVPVGVEVTES
jgi:predicted MFS family arabinose efflux permease